MSLARILSQTAYVASVVSTDSYGKHTYGTPVARQVRAEARRTMVTRANGEEAVSNHRLWCLDAINLTDRIWLPGVTPGVAETSQLPMTVSSAGDFIGSRTLFKVEL